MSIIRRIILRIRRRVPRYKAWEEMPTGWLLYFLVSTAIPVGLGAALLVSIVPELYRLAGRANLGLPRRQCRWSLVRAQPHEALRGTHLRALFPLGNKMARPLYLARGKSELHPREIRRIQVCWGGLDS